MTKYPTVLKSIFFLVIIILWLLVGNADACTDILKITAPSNGSAYTYSGSGVTGFIDTTYSSDCYSKPFELLYEMNGQVECDNYNGDLAQASCEVDGLGVGSYSIVVYERFPNGTIGATSNTVNISVNAPPTTVSLSVNSTSFNLPASIVMTANPSANGYGFISKVEFYADGNLLFTSFGSPYTYTWSNASQGNHTITAKAYNAESGAVATASLNVSVYKPPSFVAFDNQCSAKL